MSINTNPSELGTISTNVTSILNNTKEIDTAIVLSTDSTKVQFYKFPGTNYGTPFHYTNSGTTALSLFPVGSIATNTTSGTIAVVSTSSLTSDIASSTTSSQPSSTLHYGSETFSTLPNHKRLKVNINTSSVSHHPLVRYDNPLKIETVFGSALQLTAVHTETSFSIPYSTTTTPIFISYATSTSTQLSQYSSLPQAWNPIYKTVAIAGATSTAATYTGAAGTVPTTYTVTNFEYDFSESITTYNGTMNVLSSTITATHKGHLNITTSGRTSTDGKVDIAWSADGKYLAAIVGLNAATTAACGLVVASMDTSTKILTSVATASFASENNASYSICWSGSSQIFIGGAYYSAGNHTGILYNFSTATNTLTLGTFPSGLNPTGVGAGGIDRFDNGELVFKIGSTSNRTSTLRIYNPSTSSTLTIDSSIIFPSIATNDTSVMQPIASGSFGSSSHLHPFAFHHGGGSGLTNGIVASSTTSRMGVYIYNSQTSSVSGLWIGSTGSAAGPQRANWFKTKLGFILVNYSFYASTIDALAGKSPNSGDPNNPRVVAIGDFKDFTSSSLFGPSNYLNPNDVYNQRKFLLQPGQTMIFSAREHHFFSGSYNNFSSNILAVQEVE